MEITELTIRIIVLLLPGIFGTFLLEKLYYKEKLELRTFIISVIIIGFSSYFTLYIIKNFIEIIINGLKNYNPTDIHFFKVLIGTEKSIVLSEVLYSTIIGSLMGIISADIINKGKFYYIFREKIHITNSTGQDVWGELFDNNTKGLNSFVYVVDSENNRVYGGWVQNYSKNSMNPELLLSNVDVYENNVNNGKKGKKGNRTLLYSVDKIYLRINKDKTIIELLPANEKNN